MPWLLYSFAEMFLKGHLTLSADQPPKPDKYMDKMVKI